MYDSFPRFSLLFADPSAEREILYSSRILEFLGPVSGEEDSPLREILSWKTSRKDLAFRKEILEDFMESPVLLEQTERVLRRWETLNEIALRERELPEDASPEEALAALKENTRSLMEHLRFFRLAYGDMEGQAPSSGGLFAFCEFLRIHAQSPRIQSLLEQISSYPLLREGDLRAVLHLRLNRYGMKTAAEVSYLGTDDAKYLKKHPLPRDFSAELPKKNAGTVTGEALRRTSESFRHLTAGIRKRMEPLQEGLVFYQHALSQIEWARSKGYPWTVASPVAERGPVGRGIRNPGEQFGSPARPPVTLTARPLEIYEGEWGTEALRQIARIQIFSSAGLPLPAEDLIFRPEERIVLYDPEEKTVESEIEGLARLYRETRRGDVILLNHPLITVGKSPAEQIVANLLRAFQKKGAAVRLATDLSVG